MANVEDAAPHTNGSDTVTINGTNGFHSEYATKHKLPLHFIGGNALSSAKSSSVKDFVAKHDGHTVITSVSTSPPQNAADSFKGGRHLTGDNRF